MAMAVALVIMIISIPVGAMVIHIMVMAIHITLMVILTGHIHGVLFGPLLMLIGMEMVMVYTATVTDGVMVTGMVDMVEVVTVVMADMVAGTEGTLVLPITAVLLLGLKAAL